METASILSTSMTPASNGLPLSFLQFLKRVDLQGWNEGHSELIVPRDKLVLHLKVLLQNIYVDEVFYLKTYPDVEAAISNGTMPDPKTHFTHFGYFEGRLPSLNGFNSQVYLQKNPDLLPHFKNSNEQTIREHFIQYGYHEGRPH